MTGGGIPGLLANDLFRMRWAGDPRIAPAGDRVAYVETRLDAERDRPVRGVFVISLAGRGVVPVAPDAADVSCPCWSPDGRQLAIVVDDGEGSQVWLADAATGKARRFTAVTGLASEPAWSPDGRQLAFTVADGEVAGGGRRVQVIGVDGSGGRVLRFAGDTWSARWSPDGSRLAFLAQPGEFPELWAVDRALDHPMRRGGGGVGTVNAFAWAPDGQALAYLGHADGNATDANQKLWIVACAGGPARDLTAGGSLSVGQAVRGDDPRGSGSPAMCWSPSTGRIYVELSVGGTGPLGWFDSRGKSGLLCAGEHVCLSPSVSQASASQASVSEASVSEASVSEASVSEEGSLVAFVRTDASDPGEIYVVLESGRGLRRLTISNGWLDELAVPPRHLQVDRDGTTVDAWLTARDEASATRPLIVSVHGGPHYAVGWRFTFEVQRLAAQGAAVLTLNPHGSQGYGEAFSRSIRGDWGGADYADIEAAVNVVVATGAIDPARLVIWGVSYGGFMAQWALTRTDRYCLGISEHGISNFLGLWALGGGRAQGWDAAMGGPPWSSEQYVRRSPLSHAHRMHTPLLLVHAEDDRVCPISQSEQMYAALRRLGRPVDFVRLPGEGHLVNLIGRPSSRLRRAAAIDHSLPLP
ncbi:MAG: S9 family peptidase [Chloroflexota bacterium]